MLMLKLDELKKSKMLKKIVISFFIFLLFYITLSWILLDGKVIYKTSFNESSIEKSIEKGLFVTQDLIILAEGDSLKNWNNIFDIWTSKRSEVTYYGFIFNFTTTKKNWRFLNLKYKNNIQKNSWCVKNNNETFCTECCNRIGCTLGDTIVVSFYEFKKDIAIGKLKVLVK